MRIGIDGYNLAMPHGTGIATYGFTLAATLQRMGHDIDGVFGLDIGKDLATREVLFFDALSNPAPPPATRRQARADHRRLVREAASPLAIHAAQVPMTDLVAKDTFAERLPAFDRLFSRARLFAIAQRHFAIYGQFLRVKIDRPPDVMHWTSAVPVKLIGARNVYTLHDLIPLKLPYTTLDVKRSYYRLIARCVRDADQLCTVSEASAADIVAQFGVDPARITNTYQVSTLRDPTVDAPDAGEDAAAIEGIFGLQREGYFLYYGAIEPKKNIGRLVEAFLSSGVETPLVVVSSRSWGAEEELKLLASAEACGALGDGPGRRVIRLDHMSRRLLRSLVRGARAVLFPSLYEGFGLPVLEAMQMGVPVLTSRGGSLLEVAGDAAVFVDPYDVASIVRGLRAIDHDASLRATLRTKGLHQAARFSDMSYRERLTTLYERALAR